MSSVASLMGAIDPRGLVGTVIEDRYRIQECLGTGTMGSVYRAEHIHMKKKVAVKVLHPSHTRDPEVVERFQREAQAAANIEHPNICAATDFGKLDEDFYYMVMEYLDGRPLIDAIKSEEGFDELRVLHIAIQACNALEKAHERGVVHRDLKPENILLVERDGDPDFVKITDFGVAQVRLFKDMARLTQAGVVYGSPLYMSPQQAAGKEIDHRADLYSLGIIMYELLTGALPFYAKSLTIVLNMHMADPPPPFAEKNPDIQIDPEIEAIVMRLLEKKPEDRFQSATELRDALERVRSRMTRRFGIEELRRFAPVVAVGVGAIFLIWAATLIGTLIESDDGTDDATAAETLVFEPIPVFHVEEERKELLKSERVKNAVGQIATEPQEAIKELIALRNRDPSNPHFHFWLGRAFIESNQWENAFEEYARAIENDAAYVSDPRLQDDVMKRLEDPHDGDARPAEKLIKKHMRAQAAIRLAELAEHHKVRKIRKRALRILHETEQFERLPQWNQLTIKLRHAVGCEANRKLIVEIAELGDPQALAALRRFSALPKTGCGDAGNEDCYGCLRYDLRIGIERLSALQ